MTILVKSFFFEHFFWIVFALVNSYYLNCGYYTYVTKQNKSLTMNLFVLLIFLIWHDLSILLQPIQNSNSRYTNIIWQSLGLKIRFSSLSFIPPIISFHDGFCIFTIMKIRMTQPYWKRLPWETCFDLVCQSMSWYIPSIFWRLLKFQTFFANYLLLFCFVSINQMKSFVLQKTGSQADFFQNTVLWNLLKKC